MVHNQFKAFSINLNALHVNGMTHLSWPKVKIGKNVCI